MSEIERRAAEHGINVFRGLLEDEGEHYDDALRMGMLAAASEALHNGNQEALEALRKLHAASGKVPLAASQDEAATLAFITARREARSVLGRLGGIDA